MSLPRYQEYKSSGVPWLGDVPAHWAITPLKHLVRLRSGGTPSKERTDYWDGSVPWASSKDLKVEILRDTIDHVTSLAVEDGAAELVPAGASLVVVRGMILAHSFPVARVARAMAINQDLKAVLPHDAIRKDFLAWLLRGSARESLARLDEAAHGTKALRMGAWESMELPVPPTEEQACIAAFLDRETAKIDALIAEQERLVDLLEEKRQAVITQAVTKGLDPTVPMKDSGVEWLGDTAVGWSLVRLKDVVSPGGIQLGPFGGLLLDLKSEDTGFKVIGQENTMSGDLSAGQRWIDEPRYRQMENYHVRVGDVLLTRKGSLGNAHLVTRLPQYSIIDSDTIRIRCDGATISPEFLVLVLHEARYISEQIDQLKRGAILAGLNSQTVANLYVVLPPRQQQHELLVELRERLGPIEAGVEEAKRLELLLRERRAALVSAAVTGQIDVRTLVETEGARCPKSRPTGPPADSIDVTSP